MPFVDEGTFLRFDAACSWASPKHATTLMSIRCAIICRQWQTLFIVVVLPSANRAAFAAGRAIKINTAALIINPIANGIGVCCCISWRRGHCVGGRLHRRCCFSYNSCGGLSWRCGR